MGVVKRDRHLRITKKRSKRDPKTNGKVIKINCKKYFQCSYFLLRLQSSEMLRNKKGFQIEK